MGILTGGRRRKIVVDRRFQIGTTLVGLVYISAVAVFLTVPLFEMMKHVDVLLGSHSDELASFYKAQQKSTTASFVLFMFGILGGWTVFSLWRTHKIAGPLVKITRYVHQFGSGNFKDRIELRAGDQLQALARALNNMAGSLEERDQAVREETLDQIDAVRCSLMDTPSADRAVQALERLSEGVNRSFEARWEAPTAKKQAPKEPVHS
jgi:methyl-accepting chemotaxis protein